MTARPHSYARYKLDGCRCYTCAWAVATYNDRREHAIRRGTWQPFTDAQPVRDHIALLKTCGYGDRAIANLAGVDRKAIRSIVHGRTDRGTPPPARVRPATAAAILAVEPSLDTLPAKTPIDSTGTVRRLQALGAGAWPQAQLAARLDMTAGNFSALLDRSQVTAGTARSVRVLFDDLWRADPAECGVTAQAVSRTRNHARVNGWAPMGAWDDDTIDDPAAHPDWTGVCGTSAGSNAHYASGTKVCARCRAARAEYRRERTAARTGLPVPLSA